MRNHKSLITCSLILAIALTTGGCEVTVKNESSDDEYKEKYESLVTDLQSAKTEQDNQVMVASMAKSIYTGMASYITRKMVDGETVPTNVTFEDVKKDLVESGSLREIEPYIDDLSVDISLNSSEYDTNVDKVTVTYKDITQSYPD
mgnify:CR=1 FL=1